MRDALLTRSTSKQIQLRDASGRALTFVGRVHHHESLVVCFLSIARKISSVKGHDIRNHLGYIVHTSTRPRGTGRLPCFFPPPPGPVEVEIVPLFCGQKRTSKFVTEIYVWIEPFHDLLPKKKDREAFYYCRQPASSLHWPCGRRGDGTRRGSGASWRLLRASSSSSFYRLFRSSRPAC